MGPRGAGALAAILLTFGACSPTGLEDDVVVTGFVLDATSGQPIENAVVRTLNLEPESVDATDAEGAYRLVVTVSGSTDLTIEASKEGYSVATAQVLAVPDRDTVVPDFELTASETAVGTTRTGPKSIILTGLSSESILVRESGGTETADITFEVQDSTGLPMDRNSAVNVTFRFGAQPGGGETLFGTTAQSNANGRVTTSLHSGTAAGVVQVIAEIAYNGTIIRSRPASVAIHGGLPDQNHFGVAPKRVNMPWHRFGTTTEILAIAGDKYGNVATPGTAIYFNTTGGIIEGSALTDAKGSASVELISNNPYPVHAVYGPGLAVVTAHTADENDATITTSALVLMSGPAQISNIAPASFAIPNGGSQTFTFTVSDEHGNPLTEGTTISVSAADPAVTLGGDVSVTMTDVMFGGVGLTDFTFTATDADPAADAATSVTITIKTTGDNGTVQALISGTVN